jgi:hypothetical protein
VKWEKRTLPIDKPQKNITQIPKRMCLVHKQLRVKRVGARFCSIDKRFLISKKLLSFLILKMMKLMNFLKMTSKKI